MLSLFIACAANSPLLFFLATRSSRLLRRTVEVPLPVHPLLPFAIPAHHPPLLPDLVPGFLLPSNSVHRPSLHLLAVAVLRRMVHLALVLLPDTTARHRKALFLLQAALYPEGHRHQAKLTLILVLRHQVKCSLPLANPDVSSHRNIFFQWDTRGIPSWSISFSGCRASLQRQRCQDDTFFCSSFVCIRLAVCWVM
jgi:hypothetical protein